MKLATFEEIMASFAGRALESLNRELVVRSFSTCGVELRPKYRGYRSVFESFLGGLNHNLREVLHPDLLNISNECMLALSTAVEDNRVATMENYLGMVDFNEIRERSRHVKQNRRAAGKN